MFRSNPVKRFILSVFVPAAAGFLLCALSVNYFQSYGLVLFLLLPSAVGMSSSLLYGAEAINGFGRHLAITFCSLVTLGIMLLFLAIEGAACLIMAFPLSMGMAFIGTALGYSIVESRAKKHADGLVGVLLLVVMPALMGFESAVPANPAVHKVVTSVEIDAPIERVWENVVEFPEISEPPKGILRFGFAYPINARIDGKGVGAVRYCNFTTGSFVEPITTWDAPHLLAFDVREQPSPMIETTPYGQIEVAHLKYLRSHKGQFRLFEQNGKTIVEGTTFYSHEIYPDFYWKLWSDHIIHQIHLRVLNHIKATAERGA